MMTRMGFIKSLLAVPVAFAAGCATAKPRTRTPCVNANGNAYAWYPPSALRPRSFNYVIQAQAAEQHTQAMLAMKHSGDGVAMFHDSIVTWDFGQAEVQVLANILKTHGVTHA